MIFTKEDKKNCRQFLDFADWVRISVIFVVNPYIYNCVYLHPSPGLVPHRMSSPMQSATSVLRWALTSRGSQRRTCRSTSPRTRSTNFAAGSRLWMWRTRATSLSMICDATLRYPHNCYPLPKFQQSCWSYHLTPLAICPRVE